MRIAAGLLGIAVSAAWAQDACVIRQEGLHAPRRRLRYRSRPHDPQRLRLVMRQELRRDFEEGEPRKQPGPRVALDLEIAPGALEGGATPSRVRIAKAEASGGTAGAAHGALLRRSVAALEGLLGEGRVAEDGAAAELEWLAAGRLSPESQALAGQARAALLDAIVPLPRGAVGEGAAWAVRAVGEGEPRIGELVYTCSVRGDAPAIAAAASAEAEGDVEMPQEAGAPRVLRKAAGTAVRRELRLLPGRLFPAGSVTTTLTARYVAAGARFSDRQTTETLYEGPPEPEPPRITVVGAGEEPRTAVRYSGAPEARAYAVEYVTTETVAAGGRVEKRGLPRARAGVRCQEVSRKEPLDLGERFVLAWTVAESDARGLRGLSGGGAYGRSCGEVVGHAEDFAERKLETKRPRLAPQLWLELPDGASREAADAAVRLCEAIAWSMLPLPEIRWRPPREDGGEPSMLVPMMGKGGSWRHEDPLGIPGARPLERVLEYEIAEAGEASFTASVRSRDGRAPLGPAELEGLPEGSRAVLVSCTSKRTGSWTIARGLTMPARANVEDVLDRAYEVTEPDGSKGTVRIHTVRSATIEALDAE